MSDLAELLEDPAVARWLLGSVMRGMKVQTIRDGLSVPPEVMPLLAALATIVDRPDLVCFASETSSARVSSESEFGLIPTRQAAEQFIVSEQYIRKLARDKRIRSRRVGRAWLIDAESLSTVLRRTA